MTTYGTSSARTGSNGLAIAGLVCGIVGIFLLNYILGPLAIIFGGVGLSKANRGGDHRTMSLWSIALGIFDLVLFGVVLALLASHGGHFSYHVG
jgi:Domain of unknown function (DUF4190)